jgi:hypothetical protein
VAGAAVGNRLADGLGAADGLGVAGPLGFADDVNDGLADGLALPLAGALPLADALPPGRTVGGMVPAGENEDGLAEGVDPEHPETTAEASRAMVPQPTMVSHARSPATATVRTLTGPPYAPLQILFPRPPHQKRRMRILAASGRRARGQRQLWLGSCGQCKAHGLRRSAMTSLEY